MEIRQLKYFVSIAETGSFSSASRQNFLSQSAISQQIKALEEELETTLFVRTSHRVELTESGQMLLPLAQQVLQSVSECKERMADVNNLMCGELNIGVTHSLEPYIRKTMIRFMKAYPNVHLNIHYKTIAEMRTMLSNNEIDMAFCVKVDSEENWIDSTPVLAYRLCAVMRETHPLATKTMLTLNDLEKQTLIMPERALRYHNAVEEFLIKADAKLCVRAFINDPGAILKLLKQTNYISIFSKEVSQSQDGLCYIPIKELNELVYIYAHMQKGGHHKRSALEFLNMLQETIR